MIIVKFIFSEKAIEEISLLVTSKLRERFLQIFAAISENLIFNSDVGS